MSDDTPPVTTTEGEPKAIASTLHMHWGHPVHARFIFEATARDGTLCNLVVARESNTDEDDTAAWDQAIKYFRTSNKPLRQLKLTGIVTEIDDRGQAWGFDRGAKENEE